ncbi:MAG: hypothetical protein QOE54_4835 [Streptosporangiaceae bacterium]|nr:hypothetical protein [Streptosporangiaceae bacterium]
MKHRLDPGIRARPGWFSSKCRSQEETQQCWAPRALREAAASDDELARELRDSADWTDWTTSGSESEVAQAWSAAQTFRVWRTTRPQRGRPNRPGTC